MARAYKWALISPLRRVYYNLTIITTLSVVVALMIGGVVLLQLLAEQLQVDALTWVTRLDLQYVGYLLVAMFVVVWAISLAVWKLGRLEARLDTSPGGGALGEPPPPTRGQHPPFLRWSRDSVVIPVVHPTARSLRSLGCQGVPTGAEVATGAPAPRVEQVGAPRKRSRACGPIARRGVASVRPRPSRLGHVW